MSGLEEYGIKDVGFVRGEASEELLIVGYMRKDSAVDVVVAGRFVGKMYGVTRTRAVADGAELFFSSDTSMWFDEVKEA